MTSLLKASLVAGVLSAAIAACSSSTSTPAPPSGPSPTTFALSGHVTDASTNGPFAGVAVEVLDGPNRARVATSDATGTFRIADLTMGGFTVRATRAGYDSAFLGVNLFTDTSADFRMTPVMTTLAGTWAGFVSFSTSTGSQFSGQVLQATLMHTGASVSSNQFAASGSSYTASFSGTLQDPSAIGSTTGMTGTLTLIELIGGRGLTTCRGTTAFTGTINWSLMSATAPQITLDCGITYSNVKLSLVRQH